MVSFSSANKQSKVAFQH